MARPKKPSTILEASGAFKKDPQRKNHDEPEGTAFSRKPPNYIKGRQLYYWDDLIDNRIPYGVLTGSDYYAVVIMSALLVELEETKGHLTNERIAKFISMSSKLGLTPADRRNLVVDKSKTNKYATTAKTG